MPTNSQEVEDALARLKAVLVPETCQLLIQQLDRTVLDEEEQQSLTQLSAFFLPTPATGQASSSLPSPASSPGPNAIASPPGARKRPRTESNNNEESDGDDGDDADSGGEDGSSGANPNKRRKVGQGPMESLKKFTDLKPNVKNFFLENCHDPQDLFDDQHAQAEPAGQRIAKQIEKGHKGEYLTFCVDFVDRFNDRLLMDSIRVVFSYLACYDLCMSLNKGSKYKWKGNKFGPKIRKRIMEDTLGDVPFVDDAERARVLSSFELYCQRGLKLDVLCKAFGEGCLLRFAQRLDSNFIDRHLKQKGAVYERTMAILEESGIKDDDKEIGLLKFAQSVRSFCRPRFQGVAQVTGSQANSAEDSNSDNESQASPDRSALSGA